MKKSWLFLKSILGRLDVMCWCASHHLLARDRLTDRPHSENENGMDAQKISLEKVLKKQHPVLILLLKIAF